MKEKHSKIRNLFDKIILEKNEVKEKRNKSFIQPHKKYIELETDKNFLDITKNSLLLNEGEEENKVDKAIIFNKKYNVLKETIEKLKIIIEKNIKNENEITNKIIDNIYSLEQSYKKELLIEKKTTEVNLKIMKEKYFEKIDENIVNDDNKEIFKENMNKINEIINKTNIFANKQSNYFKNINSDINILNYRKSTDYSLKVNEQFNNIYKKNKDNKIRNDDETMKNINIIKKRINIFGNKECKRREDFRDDIFNILISELNKLKNINMMKLYE